jgi:hypothetical protein
MSSSYIDPEYEYHEFYLDSGDATNAYDSTISSLNWPVFNLTTPLKDVVSLKVLEAQIPMSYAVTAGTTLTINYYPQYASGATLPAPVVQSYPLPTTGTLSGAQIATYLSSQLLYGVKDPLNPTQPLPGWSRGGTQTYLVCTFTPSSNSATGLPYFTFIVNDHTNITGSVNQDFRVVISDQKTEDLLGFPVGSTNCWGFGLDTGSQKKNIDSPRPALITGAPYLYISSNTVGNLCKTYLPQGATLLGGGGSSPQMAKIPVSNVIQGQWLVWQDANPAWFDVDNISTLSQLDIYIQLGNYGGYINFQGLAFSIKLGVLVKRSARVSNNGRGTFIQSTPFFIGQR